MSAQPGMVFCPCPDCTPRSARMFPMEQGAEGGVVVETICVTLAELLRSCDVRIENVKFHQHPSGAVYIQRTR